MFFEILKNFIAREKREKRNGFEFGIIYESFSLYRLASGFSEIVYRKRDIKKLYFIFIVYVHLLKRMDSHARAQC